MSRRERASSIAEEARAIVERLGGRWTERGGLCRCPAHDDRTPSLSVRPGRSRLLLHCFGGCAPVEILRALAAERLIEPGGPRAGAVPSEPVADAGREAAVRLWGGARELTGTAAEAYLRLRGLETVSPELRFHPRTPQGPRPSTRFRPALIAAVRDGAGLVGVHRTFLAVTRGSIADRPTARAALGRLGGGAVRLGGPASRLGLAEGVETALSATALFGLPCWATLGAERFPLISLPDMVNELVLFLDNDAGGRRAEALAREAFGHLSIEVRYPRCTGDDWNDVLRRRRGRRSGR